MVDKYLSLDDGLLWYKGRLYILEKQDLKLYILEQDHDFKVAGHWGYGKTLEILTRNWYWSNMDQTVRNYVNICDEC